MAALSNCRRVDLEATVNSKNSASGLRPDQSGFSLIEVMISMVVLTIGLLAVLAALAVTMAANQTSQEDLIARQVASEAMESIFTARNTSQLPFSSIANTTAAPPGIFVAGALPLLCAGPDGILGTADDAPCLNASGAVCPNGGVECLTEPGPDGILGTADDQIRSLNNYTRTITITPLDDSSGNPIPTLVQVAITINYSVSNVGHLKNYVLIEYISSYH
jgi:prepilin-type N-terminal cleavage/methylation domain-containing protein